MRRVDEAKRLNPKGFFEWFRGLALFSLERYEEAAAELQTARSLSPAGPALVMLMATYAHLDRQEEMQALRDEFFEVTEKRFGRPPTISGTLRFTPWAKPEDRERLASALRKAGVPE